MAFGNLLGAPFEADPVRVAQIGRIPDLAVAIHAPELAFAHDDLPQGARNLLPVAVLHAARRGAPDRVVGGGSAHHGTVVAVEGMRQRREAERRDREYEVSSKFLHGVSC
ncbi:MAG: hypothetical protein KGI35_11995 [Burkholderiales bacterium]|nr:hypothetical protein [Burkholderiales bacterium]